MLGTLRFFSAFSLSALSWGSYNAHSAFHISVVNGLGKVTMLKRKATWIGL